MNWVFMFSSWRIVRGTRQPFGKQCLSCRKRLICSTPKIMEYLMEVSQQQICRFCETVSCDHSALPTMLRNAPNQFQSYLLYRKGIKRRSEGQATPTPFIREAHSFFFEGFQPSFRQLTPSSQTCEIYRTSCLSLHSLCPVWYTLPLCPPSCRS